MCKHEKKNITYDDSFMYVSAFKYSFFSNYNNSFYIQKNLEKICY